MKSVGSTYGLPGSLTERISAISVGAGTVGVSGLDDHREEMYTPVKTSGAATLTVNSSPATGAAVLTGGPATSELLLLLLATTPRPLTSVSLPFRHNSTPDLWLSRLSPMLLSQL